MDFLQALYQGYYMLYEEGKTFWDFVVRAGAVGVIVLHLYLIQDEDTNFNLDFQTACIMFLAALFFTVPALFAGLFFFWIGILGLVAFFFMS